VDEGLSSIFFNLCMYSSVVVGDTFQEELMRQLNVLHESNNQGLDNFIEGRKEAKAKRRLKDMSQKLNRRKEGLQRKQEAIDRTMRYIQCFGKVNDINILNKQYMDQWLLPSVILIVILIATLVKIVEEGVIEC